MTKETDKNLSQRFQRFSEESHAKGSGTATSYVRAIKKLTTALQDFAVFLQPGKSVWDIHDVDHLAQLYLFVKEEQKKADGGIFRNESAKSYWKKGFCSAAVKEFAKFLTLDQRQEQMLIAFDSASDGAILAKSLEFMKLRPSSMLLDNDDIVLSSAEGKTAIREVEVRMNQNVFREMVLQNYHFQCCLTGLPMAEVLRASHISPWATDKKNRLNPENGLCLSATYDAAFDRYLISFDEDYRLIFAPSLKEYYTNKAFREYFSKQLGQKIMMPKRFMPSQTLLEKHRRLLA
ncbi:MAG: HNH endonuclease signature motif containing protein [Lentisphaeria bacterium]